MEKPKLSKLDSESESKSISYFQLVKHIHDSFPLLKDKKERNKIP
mgnify:CR=1 FL=1